MTAPRAIFFENHKKKQVPYEGCTRRSDRAGKTGTALLEMRTAPQKQCETVLLLQSVFWKKNGQMIEFLLTEWGRAGRENICTRRTFFASLWITI